MSDRSQPEVVAVVVTYQGSASIEACLECLAATRYPALRVVVLDNASTDGTADLVEEFSDRRVQAAGPVGKVDFQVVRSPRNLGFAGGVNHGVRTSLGSSGTSADIVALVNQDCLVAPHWLDPLVAQLLEDPSVAVVGSKLIAADSTTTEHRGGIVHANGLTDHLGKGECASSQLSSTEVDYVCGALCAFHADTWRELGGFDERYFPAYFEEVDFCLRLRERGRRTVCVPQSEARHESAATLGRDSAAYLRAYHRGRLRLVVDRLVPQNGWLGFLRAELVWLGKRPGARNLVAALGAYFRVPMFMFERFRSRGLGERT